MISGNFEPAVNQASKLNCYPIPRIEDIFVKLAGGKLFTHLDLSQVTQQLLLHESKDYVMINIIRDIQVQSIACHLEYHQLQKYYNIQWKHSSRALKMLWFTLMIF